MPLSPLLAALQPHVPRVVRSVRAHPRADQTIEIIARCQLNVIALKRVGPAAWRGGAMGTGVEASSGLDFFGSFFI